MRKIDLLHLIEGDIRNYRLDANESLRRNDHMNENVMKGRKDIPQKIIDALLVDFLNYVGAEEGVDYAMYTKHLKEKRDPTKL